MSNDTVIDTECLFSGELLSALADGELRADEFLRWAGPARSEITSAAVLADWSAFHLIGEVLRSADAVAGDTALPFLAGLRQTLAAEPLYASAPHVLPVVSQSQALVPGALAAASGALRPAANDALFRWKLAAGFATLAAVSVLGWNSLSLLLPAPVGTPGQFLAQVQSSPQADSQLLVSSPQGPVVRDARLEELLAAHRQAGGGSLLPVPSGFLRNAAFDTSPDLGR